MARGKGPAPPWGSGPSRSKLPVDKPEVHGGGGGAFHFKPLCTFFLVHVLVRLRLHLETVLAKESTPAACSLMSRPCCWAAMPGSARLCQACSPTDSAQALLWWSRLLCVQLPFSAPLFGDRDVSISSSPAPLTLVTCGSRVAGRSSGVGRGPRSENRLTSTSPEFSQPLISPMDPWGTCALK